MKTLFSGCLFVCFGAVFLVIGLFTLRANLNLVRVGRHATGTVVELVRSRDKDGDVVYYPIVQYTPDNGDRVTFKSNVGSSHAPSVGEKVQIVYNPQNPKQAAIDTFTDLWLLPVVFTGIGGLIVVGAGAGVFTFLWRRAV